MAKIKPQLSGNEMLFFDLLVETYASGVINESVDAITAHLKAYNFKRSTVHRYIRKLFDYGFLIEVGRTGETGRIAKYKIKK